MTTIGIDYTPAYEQGGGIGRYVRELVNALAQQDTLTDYRLFVAGAQRNLQRHQLDLGHAVNFTVHPTVLNTKWLARMWHRARLPLPVETFTGDVSLFHATDFVLPPTHPHTRTLLTVHDLSFIRSPQTASPRLRRYLMQVVPRSIARADHILADSTATKADVVDVYNTPASKITVLLSGVDERFAPVSDQTALRAVRDRYHIGAEPYIFSIGTIQPRKNYARLVEALARLRQRNLAVNLVIAGGKGWLEDEIYSAIRQHDMQDAVKFIGYAADEDLPALYSGASCCAFVSLYEGFGLPILESMACGTPVLTSNVSSLPEVAGDAAPMVPPRDVDAITNALHEILTDDGYHSDLRRRGFAQASRFTWAAAAHQLLDVYRELLS